MDSKLKLYDFHGAPSPRRVRIFLAEKNIEYDCVQINIREKEQFSDAFRAINPRCAVPALDIGDGEILTENLAMASYIESQYPQPPLMGTTDIERALILEWNWRIEFEGLMAIAELLRNSSPHMKDRAMTGPHNIEQIPELAERGRLRLGHFYDVLETQLKSNAFVAGNDFTLADISALVMVDFAGWVKAVPDDTYKAIWDWHKKVSTRPSAKA